MDIGKVKEFLETVRDTNSNLYVNPKNEPMTPEELDNNLSRFGKSLGLALVTGRDVNKIRTSSEEVQLAKSSLGKDKYEIWNIFLYCTEQLYEKDNKGLYLNAFKRNIRLDLMKLQVITERIFTTAYEETNRKVAESNRPEAIDHFLYDAINTNPDYQSLIALNQALLDNKI